MVYNSNDWIVCLITCSDHLKTRQKVYKKLNGRYSDSCCTWNQCCHIWGFVTNLATFDTNLLPKFSFGYLGFLATFKSLAKNWF